MTGYLEVHEGWERLSADGPRPFVTTELLRRPDGTLVRWHSRAHRKGRIAPAAGEPPFLLSEPVWWRPRRRGWWISVLFATGALCFAAAAVASQWASAPRSWIGVTFFAGSIMFTAAAYLQYSEAVNVERRPERDAPHARRRKASWEPGRIDWLAALIQLAGTVFFNISTFAVMKHDLSGHPHQTSLRTWAPDALGSACFLIASELAYAEVCHRWVCLRSRSLSWRIVSLNLLGSIAFATAATAALIGSSTGEPLSARITHAGTALGGLCFLVAALTLMPETAREQRVAPGVGRAIGG